MSDEIVAQQLAARWAVRAGGRRPEDFRARDLLFGSLFRDPRPARFNRLTREYRETLPDWPTA
jgi:hypothetical protein